MLRLRSCAAAERASAVGRAPPSFALQHTEQETGERTDVGGDRLLCAGYYRGRLGVRGDRRAQSRALGAVPDPDVLHVGGPLRAARRRVPGDAAGRRLCRRRRGAVPVRRDDARRRFRRAEAGLPVATCRSASSSRWCCSASSASSPAPRSRRTARRSRLRRQRRAKSPTPKRIGRGALHRLSAGLPNGGPGAARRHDRRDRADAAPPPGRQEAGHRRPSRPQALRRRSNSRTCVRDRGSADGNHARPLSVRRRRAVHDRRASAFS